MSREPQADQLRTTLANHTIPLHSTNPGHALDDLTPLTAALDGVRVVGLGEATHGTREFFTLKHRLVEFLVTRLSFTVFAIEAGWSSCRAVDDYVVHGTGSAAEVLAKLGYWTWDTEEVLALIEWLRAHNADLPLDQRVRFRGVDPVLERAGTEAIAGYLDTVDSARATTFRGAVKALRAEFSKLSVGRIISEAFRQLWRKIPGVRPGAAQSEVLAARAVVADTVAWLAAHPADNDGWREAEWHAWAVDRAAEIRTLPTLGQAGGHLRDRTMAEALRRILAEPGARAMVWAHNGHLAAATRSSKEAALGAELRDWLGDGYYALALVTNQGGFQAMKLGTSELAEFELDPAESGTLEWQLAQAGGDHLLDLRAAGADPVLRAWLDGKQRMRAYGSVIGFWPALKKETVSVRLGAEFDGIAYLDRTTRARPRTDAADRKSGADSRRGGV
ncbi:MULTISPECIES: erythromycin esterase family protein [unclassified Crossiella]|uniref:erythromycin esterase family protein n=1 Tax=unclassified Crossiella TaxID=2620835 RepID=UPI001FFF4AF2|nr:MULTISPECIES: erythromycin esterase family protein [unclassified Crossiella]MCK2241731.1 erythromycin esterase family protein [Crossiella sp. S99.2]MCK2255397.1 erythromycin esterase family protein [Crossiella sp. S99.1]